MNIYTNYYYKRFKILFNPICGEMIEMRPVRIGRKDIILLSIDLIEDDIDINQLVRRWGITEKTLRKYLNTMNKSGFISIRNEEFSNSIQLTNSGKEELKRLKSIISRTILDPVSSGFVKKVNLEMVLDHLKNPYEELEFLDRFFLKKKQILLPFWMKSRLCDPIQGFPDTSTKSFR